MINNRKISSKVIIAKVIRDNKPFIGENIEWLSMLEWIAEANELINGAYSAKEDWTEIKIENFEGVIPFNYERVISVVCNGRALSPLTKHTKRIDSSTVSNSNGESYIIDYPYIQTTFREGTITLNYYSFPVDEEGFPMVDGTAETKEAISTYVKLKILEPLEVTGAVSERIVEKTRLKWESYKVKARGIQNMNAYGNPSYMKNVKNAWLRLVPRVNELENDFDTIANQEKLYLNGRIR